MQRQKRTSFAQWASVILLSSSGILAGCNSGSFSATATSPLTESSRTWNFATASDYTYDSNYILISGSSASLKTVNTTLSDATTFNAGTHAGTSYATSKLTLSASASTELTAAWAPRWSHLVGYWKMDNDWVDSSTQGKDLQVLGAPTFTTSSKVGTYAGNFNGTTDALQNLNWLDVNSFTEMTVAGWMYRNSSATNGGSLFYIPESASYGGVRLRLFQSGNGLCFRFGNGTSGSENCVYPAPFTEDSWFHLAATHKANGTNDLYVNGELIGSYAAGGHMMNASNVLQMSHTDENYYHGGKLDDIAVWDAKLTSAEIALIYNRQKQKYAGTYDSPILNMGASASWPDLRVTTSIPFYKEMATATESSSTSGYASITSNGENLSSGLVALWHMNETSGTTLADSTATGLTLTTNNTPTLGAGGVLGKAVNLARASSQYLTTASYDVGTTFTYAVWARMSRTTSSVQTLLANNQSGGADDGFQLTLNTTGTDDGKVFFSTTNNSAVAANAVSTAGVATPGVWHHYLVVVDRTLGTAQIYVDGVQVNVGSTTIRTDFKTNAILYMGRLASNDGYLDGRLDEAALWNRKLSAFEINQLYRRGANRSYYQVRSCIDSACACKSYGAGGTAADCSGDGSANDLLGTDPLQATWFGPDGTSATFFSELQNSSSVNASGVATGTVGLAGLDLDWSGTFFTSAARPSNNPYFQFRVFMESADEHSLCSSAPCMPEITSMRAGPTGRYYGGSPSIINNSAVAYTNLVTLTQSASGACTKYQVSTDSGATWQYWTGSAWAAAVSTANSNLASDYVGHLGALSAGNFKFKAFLSTNTAVDFTSSCSLTNVGITLFGK